MTSLTSLSDRRMRLSPCFCVLSSPKQESPPEDATEGQMPQRSNEEAGAGSPFQENAVDRDYRNFLNHLKVYGKSYVLEVMDGSPPRSVRLKYEFEEEEEVEAPGVEKLFKIEKGLKLDSPILGLREREDFEENEVVDECYDYFLDNVRLCGGSMVLGLPDDCIVKYQGVGEENEEEEHGEEVREEKSQVKEEDGQSEDSLTERTVSSKDSSTRPCISDTAAYQSYMESIRHRATSFFRNSLIDTLSKPFNQGEYEDLMVLAGARTPQVKHKHLRSDSIPYKTGKLGCSYFDYFPDFAKEVERADCYKGLALMRGFFFWLKNLGHDGAFMPWMSSFQTYHV
ncbi:hypothetical protein AXF42_Ash021204 [Apostasia shenzhenica]|uniref:Uncharacterized protein n=1 Tax=Apostasia shenzhenica TaxID=1088818 RepID=A0A2I0AXC2_9ASPA|nr:hypothetical protein AXF42_Ash021204 [Apostasia shenzhenica]